MRILIACVLLFPFSVFAGSVGTTKTFASGDTLTATDLNGNVTALTSAINDNDVRITANDLAITNNDAAIANIRPALGYYANGVLIGWAGLDGFIISSKDYLFGFDQTGTIGIHFLSTTSFESIDCSGQGYNRHWDTRMTNGEVYRERNTGTIYQIPANATVVATLNYNSQLLDGGCNAATGTLNGVYPIQVNDPVVTGVQNSYTPPFHIGIQ